MVGKGHQLLELKLLEATMWGFTGVDICHGPEQVTSRYVGRQREEIHPDVEGSNDFQHIFFQLY